MTRGVRYVWVGVWCLGWPAVLSADALVMRDGRRVHGELIAVRDGVIEFEGRESFGGRERIRVDRDEGDSRNPESFSERGGGSGRPAGLREREISVGSVLSSGPAAGLTGRGF